MVIEEKVATVVFRITAISFILTAIVELGLVLAGILLISIKAMPHEALAHEVYLLHSVFFTIAGIILYARSRALAAYVVDGLTGETKDES